MEKSIASIEVRVHGRPLREHLHKGEYWMEGRKGSDFTVRVRNKTWQRILAIVSIDGLSVMDGKEASFDSGGYVIDGQGQIDIPGWRLDNKKIAKFRFGKSGKSYAAKEGKPLNIGVVGCAVFIEQQIGYYICEPWGGRNRYGGGDGTFTTSSTSLPPIAESNQVYGTEINCFFAQDQAPSLGTEFGKMEDHRVSTVTFVRANETPDEIYEIRYADRSELERRGVDLKRKPVIANRPTAFPKETGCKPPEGWTG